MAYYPIPFGRKVQDKFSIELNKGLMAAAQAYENRVKERLPIIFKQCADEILIQRMRTQYLKKGPRTVDSTRLRMPGGILAHSLWMFSSPFKYSKAKQAFSDYTASSTSINLRLVISPSAGIIFGYFHEYGFHGQVNVGEYTRRRSGSFSHTPLSEIRKNESKLGSSMVTVKAHSKKYNYLGRRYIQPVLEDRVAMVQFKMVVGEKINKYLRSLGYKSTVRTR